MLINLIVESKGNSLRLHSQNQVYRHNPRKKDKTVETYYADEGCRGRASETAHGPLISKEFILNLVGNELQELFQYELEDFMSIFPSKGS